MAVVSSEMWLEFVARVIDATDCRGILPDFRSDVVCFPKLDGRHSGCVLELANGRPRRWYAKIQRFDAREAMALFVLRRLELAPQQVYVLRLNEDPPAALLQDRKVSKLPGDNCLVLTCDAGWNGTRQLSWRRFEPNRVPRIPELGLRLLFHVLVQADFRNLENWAWRIDDLDDSTAVPIVVDLAEVREGPGLWDPDVQQLDDAFWGQGTREEWRAGMLWVLARGSVSRAVFLAFEEALAVVNQRAPDPFAGDRELFHRESERVRLLDCYLRHVDSTWLGLRRKLE